MARSGRSLAAPEAGVERGELAFGGGEPELQQLGARGRHDVPHVDEARPGRRGRERGPDRDLLDGAAREIEPAREEPDVDVGGEGRHEQSAARSLRVPASSGRLKSTMKRRRRTKAGSRFWRKFVVRIARPDEGLHPLEQEGDLDVGVAIVRVLDLAALAEERVGLVEAQDGPGPLGVA